MQLTLVVTAQVANYHCLLTRTYSVNQLQLKDWSTAPEFDQDTDRSKFRQFEDARDSVKSFYKEQHGRSGTYNTRQSLKGSL